MKRLSRYIEALRTGAVIDAKNANTGNFVVMPLYMTVQDGMGGLAVTSWGVNHTSYVLSGIEGKFKVAAVTVIFDVTSASGTIDVEYCTGTTAVGSGTSQLTAPMNVAGTARTPVAGTLIASPNTLSAGDRINLLFGGTLTGLSKALVSIVLERVQ